MKVNLYRKKTTLFLVVMTVILLGVAVFLAISLQNRNVAPSDSLAAEDCEAIRDDTYNSCYSDNNCGRLTGAAEDNCDQACVNEAVAAAQVCEERNSSETDPSNCSSNDGDREACDAAGCAYYFCDRSCRTRGTPVEDVCGDVPDCPLDRSQCSRNALQGTSLCAIRVDPSQVASSYCCPSGERIVALTDGTLVCSGVVPTPTTRPSDGGNDSDPEPTQSSGLQPTVNNASKYPKCVGISITYSNRQGQMITETSNSYLTTKIVSPGSSVTINNLILEDNTTTTRLGFYAFELDSEGNAIDNNNNGRRAFNSSGQIDDIADLGPLRAFPFTLVSSNTPGAIGQINGIGQYNDVLLQNNPERYGSPACAVRIQAASVVVAQTGIPTNTITPTQGIAQTQAIPTNTPIQALSSSVTVTHIPQGSSGLPSSGIENPLLISLGVFLLVFSVLMSRLHFRKKNSDSFDRST